MQSTYNTDPSIAVAGQAVHIDNMVGEFQCSEDIPPGRVVELHTDGKLRLPQGTGADIPKIAGVSIYRGALEPGAYKTGEYVPLVRKGQVWVELVSGATVSPLSAANVYHSSTLAVNRGKVGSAAEAGGAGVEIDATGKTYFRRANLATSPTLALVEVNLP